MVLVGGLTEIGFVAETSLLLVVGHQGRGLIDCGAGDRAAHDRSEDFAEWSDASHRRVLGIGSADGEWIEVFGLWGGEGVSQTSDGWRSTVDGEDVVLARGDARQVISPGPEELRAFGFSPGGDYFVLASPGDVTIFDRG